ncbi:5-methylthioadenosine/S-adenosylhomocysteine deaminase [Sinobacterium caligoides]|uniref:5-methylthioadenosine/S-adenosylhomocysteine deaminase n=1 Tax=Sinobacterium caligoides TaxID=933926 RepID=A0A3N2E0B0_9GAMM|nr:TRZ/ATZ family hydrolase [Sinobacterium caligoides]ROS05139.1 5-methylthioadenosine/S-adenosylhomocysteine deaminase [Sinobacterium caligoides]
MSQEQSIDTLISAGWVIPVDDAQSCHTNHALAIDKGIIIDYGPRQQLQQRYRGRIEKHLADHLLIPGLINCHGHAAMTLLRGYADDYPLMEWLQEHIWPAESRWVDGDFVRDGTELAIAEMLLGGTTCFSDMYFFPEQAAEAIEASGIRAQLCATVLDFANNWASGADDALAKAGILAQQYHDHPRITVALGPHAPYTVSDENFNKVINTAKQHQLKIQIHCHETQQEVDDSLREHGMRPLQRLEQLGLLTANTQLVHMTALNDDDIARVRRSGASIVHCPESNLKLASGFCPVDKLHKQGINIAIGTDGAASNNDLDLLGELRTGALLAKAVAGDASAVKAHQALEMATINGARALGLEQQLGSLSIGKFADIVALDMTTLTAQPVYNPLSQLIYGNNTLAISDVWVAGQQLLDERQLTTLDTGHIHQRTTQWRNKIRNDNDR